MPVGSGLRLGIGVYLLDREGAVNRMQPLRASFARRAALVLQPPAAICHPHARKKDFWILKEEEIGTAALGVAQLRLMPVARRK